MPLANTKTSQSATAHVRHTFTASAEDVFDAWLDADVLARWMFHPNIRQEEVINLSLDGRPGGTFRFHVRRGDEKLEYYGTYYDVNRPTQLVFSWISAKDHKKTLVSVTIQENNTGCELNLTHELGACAEDYIHFVEMRWRAEFAILSELVN